MPGRWTVLILLAALVPSPLSLHAAENLLRNPGFEEGAEASFPGWSPVWPPMPEPPRFSRVAAEKAHGGAAAAEVRVPGSRGYTSLTQTIPEPPAGATSARLEGWVRAEAGTHADLLLIVFDPADASKEKVFSTPRAADSGQWVKVELEAAIPPWSKRWMVRCGIRGAGRAEFDDVTLTASTEALDAVESLLVAGRSSWTVTPSSREASITFSIPFPFGGQTPVAISVESDPPGAVARLEVRKERENRPLRVTVRSPSGKKGPIRLRAETLVLLRDRPLSDGAGVALAPPAAVPPEARLHLKGAPGVDIADRKVKEAAAKLPRADARALLQGLTAFLKGDLRYEGGGNQGARACLETGRAVCTGYANVAAAVLAAAGVPARILACTQTEGKLQEHYVVEAWARGPGWMRVETTMAEFPWPDSRNLIVRIVHPDSPRSPFQVPLFFELQGAAEGGFDGDPADGCWQSAETLGSFLLDRKDLEVIEPAARKAFEALAAKPATASRVRLLPESLPGLGERGRRLVERIAQ